MSFFFDLVADFQGCRSRGEESGTNKIIYFPERGAYAAYAPCMCTPLPANVSKLFCSFFEHRTRRVAYAMNSFVGVHIFVENCLHASELSAGVDFHRPG